MTTQRRRMCTRPRPSRTGAAFCCLSDGHAGICALSRPEEKTRGAAARTGSSLTKEHEMTTKPTMSCLSTNRDGRPCTRPPGHADACLYSTRDAPLAAAGTDEPEVVGAALAYADAVRAAARARDGGAGGAGAAFCTRNARCIREAGHADDCKDGAAAETVSAAPPAVTDPQAFRAAQYDPDDPAAQTQELLGRQQQAYALAEGNAAAQREFDAAVLALDTRTAAATERVATALEALLVHLRSRSSR